jgi:predicted RNA binding protein YcfA (HicA-like mRNA interferase family)
MPTLPGLSGRAVMKAFERGGWTKARQRGSHVVMVKDGSMATLSVPDHKEVAKGTLRSLIRASSLSVDEFIALTR